ncbi:MAG: DUF2807 domain-containing protein [Hyphomonadaceae bacterium]
MRAILLAAAGLAALSAPAAAQPYRATGVDIADAAALVTIIPEDRADIDVSVVAGRADLPAPQVRLNGDRVRIDGGLRDRLNGCGGIFVTGPRLPVIIRGLGQVPAEDLPRITIRAPRTLDLDSRGSIYGDIGPSQGGRLQVQGCGAYEVAAVSGALELQANGSGDVNVASVAGNLRASLDGSGDVRVGDVGGDAELMLNGSGDVRVNDVGGMLTAALRGSGDVQARDVRREAGLSLDGSGDVQARRVRGGLRAALDGSGGVAVDSVEGGTVSLELDGSGDLDIGGGRADRLVVRAAGSGGVSFGGNATVLDAELQGSGDIHVAEVDRAERVIDRGSGDIDYN